MNAKWVKLETGLSPDAYTLYDQEHNVSLVIAVVIDPRFGAPRWRFRAFAGTIGWVNEPLSTWSTIHETKLSAAEAAEDSVRHWVDGNDHLTWLSEMTYQEHRKKNGGNLPL